MEEIAGIDMCETTLHEFDADVLNLLFDHTTRKNIMWCTDNHAASDKVFASNRLF